MSKKRASNTMLKGGRSVNAKDALKLKHLQRLTALKLSDVKQFCSPASTALFELKKNRAKARRRSKKPANFTYTRNNVVYTCHLCSERNLKRGTSLRRMKAICPTKTKKNSNLRPSRSHSQTFVSPKKSTSSENMARRLQIGTPIDEEIPIVGKIIISSKADEEIHTMNSPTTPMMKPIITLLDSKRKKRYKSASEKRSEPEGSPAAAEAENPASTTTKRRRKSWTSLKELADRNQQKKNISNLSIPFLM